MERMRRCPCRHVACNTRCSSRLAHGQPWFCSVHTGHSTTHPLSFFRLFLRKRSGFRLVLSIRSCLTISSKTAEMFVSRRLGQRGNTPVDDSPQTSQSMDSPTSPRSVPPSRSRSPARHSSHSCLPSAPSLREQTCSLTADKHERNGHVFRR